MAQNYDYMKKHTHTHTHAQHTHAQTKDALEELERVLVKCGSDKHHLLSMQVYSSKAAVKQQ